MLHDLLLLFNRLEASFSVVSVALVSVTFKFVQTKLTHELAAIMADLVCAN
jgi:hypothetical protein